MDAKQIARQIESQSHQYRQEILTAWQAGNDAGNGFALGDVRHTPEQAVIEERWDILATYEEGRVVAWDGNNNRIVVVCDANGPWAVDVTDALLKTLGTK
jgi:hypothetical protein